MNRQQSEKWHSEDLQHIGLATDLTFVQLVDEATNASMRETSEGDLLVKINHVAEFLYVVATCFGDLSVDHYYDVFPAPFAYRAVP